MSIQLIDIGMLKMIIFVKKKYLIVSFEIDPTSHAFDHLFPFLGIPHHNTSAMCIILLNTHLLIIFFKPNK